MHILHLPRWKPTLLLVVSVLLFGSAAFVGIVPVEASPAQDDVCEAPFEEVNGRVIIEMESATNLPSNWEVRTDRNGYTGSGYLQWKGGQFFRDPGNGVFEFKVKINDPGAYEFKWRSSINIDDLNSEHNDSWFRVPDAADFYAVKGDSIIYPRGTGKTPNPEGASGDGWFKVFTNQLDWSWDSKTSDGDAHKIFVQFDTPGVYTLQVSARSTGHGIDRMVLAKNFISNANATTAAETRCDGEIIAPTTYTITANAGSGGSISPSGGVTVDKGDNQTFNITPNNGFEIANVLVNGQSVGTPSAYTFNNVQANQSISATFTRTTYTITASAGSGGSISPSGGVSVFEGDNQTFNITPDADFEIADVLVNGQSVGAVATYTFNNVQADATITASFSEALDLGSFQLTAPTGELEAASTVTVEWQPIADATYYVLDVYKPGAAFDMGTDRYVVEEAGNCTDTTCTAEIVTGYALGTFNVWTIPGVGATFGDWALSSFDTVLGAVDLGLEGQVRPPSPSVTIDFELSPAAGYAVLDVYIPGRIFNINNDRYIVERSTCGATCSVTINTYSATGDIAIWAIAGFGANTFGPWSFHSLTKGIGAVALTSPIGPTAFSDPVTLTWEAAPGSAYTILDVVRPGLPFNMETDRFIVETSSSACVEGSCSLTLPTNGIAGTYTIWMIAGNGTAFGSWVPSIFTLSPSLTGVSAMQTDSVDVMGSAQTELPALDTSAVEAAVEGFGN